jgi:hypothetical protein
MIIVFIELYFRIERGMLTSNLFYQLFFCIFCLCKGKIF